MELKKYKVTCKNLIHGEQTVDFAVNVSKNNRPAFIKTIDGQIDTSIILTWANHTMLNFYPKEPKYYSLKTIPDKMKIAPDNPSLELLFSNCWNLTEVDLSTLGSTRNITDMSFMFNGCNKISSINFGEDFDTSNVKNMISMFRNTYRLEHIDVSNFSTSNVIKTNGMFESTALKELDLSNFDTGKVQNMTMMMRFSDKLESIKLNFNMQSITEARNMFEGCKVLADGDIRFYNVPRSKWADREAFMEYTMLDKCPIADKVVVEFMD